MHPSKYLPRTCLGSDFGELRSVDKEIYGSKGSDVNMISCILMGYKGINMDQYKQQYIKHMLSLYPSIIKYIYIYSYVSINEYHMTF